MSELRAELHLCSCADGSLAVQVLRSRSRSRWAMPGFCLTRRHCRALTFCPFAGFDGRLPRRDGLQPREDLHCSRGRPFLVRGVGSTSPRRWLTSPLLRRRAAFPPAPTPSPSTPHPYKSSISAMRLTSASTAQRRPTTSRVRFSALPLPRRGSPPLSRPVITFNTIRRSSDPERFAEYRDTNAASIPWTVSYPAGTRFVVAVYGANSSFASAQDLTIAAGGANSTSW